mmetsp:Transcript_32085/g.50081  ORF Transcript_32085/g.50081 Transcript_32085/m.50081 type:complete len:133 (-) Transcript_32085:441-839(-)
MPGGVGAEEPGALLKAARASLDGVEGLIKAGEWDKCRTVLNKPPLAFTGSGSAKDLMDQVANALPSGMKGAAKGIAQDVLTNTRLLDTFCYNNVFVDEGREVLGVKKDFKTPLMYLQASKDSLDQFLELLGE